jgi:hypothetical protein
LDAAAAIEAAPRVFDLIALELSRDNGWKISQLTDFRTVALNYLLKPAPETFNIK